MLTTTDTTTAPAADTDRAAALIPRLQETGRDQLALDIARKHGDLVWVADDGNQPVEYDYLDTAAEAAQEYVDDGSWGDIEQTEWVTVYVYPRYRVGDVDLDDEDARETHTIALEPEEPECVEGEDHDWQSPHGIVGGIKENPGVRGHGGGVIITECCMRCGCERTTDTWAQNRETGEQGLTSVAYEPRKYADEIPAPEERELDGRVPGCAQLVRCAAYVLAMLREPYDPHGSILLGVEVAHAQRAVDVAAYALRVRDAVARSNQARAVRLALRLAARDPRELATADVISRRWT